MPSERIQRQVDALLDEAEAAIRGDDWAMVRQRANAALSLDPGSSDAAALLAAAERNLGGPGAAPSAPTASRESQATPPAARSPQPAAPLPAAFAAGRYRVLRFLGEGGRKRVYLAHDTRLDRDVAFCAIRTEGLDRVGHERVLREAQAMGRLGAHPNLVTIHDIGEENGTPYIVEEYMAGGDAAGLLRSAGGRGHAAVGTEWRPSVAESDAPAGGASIPVATTLAIARDVCRGLSFIHDRGLVHRDVKPANVFLASDGTAKIGDFGLAVALDRTRLTQHGLILGTVSYMPPEQALSGESTARADLYSLGAMLYEMVTGRPPFVGDDPTAVISQHINMPPVAPSWVTEHCPPSLVAIILGLLE